jgi:hypothetical protein
MSENVRKRKETRRQRSSQLFNSSGLSESIWQINLSFLVIATCFMQVTYNWVLESILLQVSTLPILLAISE